MKSRTKTFDVVGIKTTVHPFSMEPRQMTVRYTADEKGKSLSISDNSVMLHVPFDAIAEAIKQ